MRATSAVIIVALGILVLYLVVTGKFAAMLDCISQYGSSVPSGQPAQGPVATSP